MHCATCQHGIGCKPWLRVVTACGRMGVLHCRPRPMACVVWVELNCCCIVVCAPCNWICALLRVVVCHFSACCSLAWGPKGQEVVWRSLQVMACNSMQAWAVCNLTAAGEAGPLTLSCLCLALVLQRSHAGQRWRPVHQAAEGQHIYRGGGWSRQPVALLGQAGAQGGGYAGGAWPTS